MSAGPSPGDERGPGVRELPLGNEQSEKTFGIWKSWDVKRRICAKSNKIIIKAGVGLMSTVPQDGQDDRHVNDDPSSLRKSIRDQKQ